MGKVVTLSEEDSTFDSIGIAVCGKLRSGKDTFAEIVKEYLGAKEFKFSAGISEIIHKYYPERSRKGKLREHYQKIGQALRQLDPYVWIDHTDRAIRAYHKEMGKQSPVIISDVRQKNEYRYAKGNNYIVIKIEADEDIRIDRAIEAGDLWHNGTLRHETELAVDDIPADIVITNNGTLEEFKEASLALIVVLSAARVAGVDFGDYLAKNPDLFRSYGNIKINYI